MGTNTGINKSARVLNNVNSIIYGTSAQTFKTNTFVYLTEMLAAYECDLEHATSYDNRKVDISANIETLNAKDYMQFILNKIMEDNNLNQVDKNIYIFLTFVAFESINLSINASIFDEEMDAEEIEYILFHDVYNRDLNRILIYNPLSLSAQELLENYSRVFINDYFINIKDMHDRIYKSGGSGDFIGWTLNLVDSIFDLNINNISVNKLLSLADYYVLIINEIELQET